MKFSFPSEQTLLHINNSCAEYPNTYNLSMYIQYYSYNQKCVCHKFKCNYTQRETRLHEQENELMQGYEFYIHVEVNELTHG